MAIVLVSSFYYFYKYVHQRGFLLMGEHLDRKKIYKTDILDKKGRLQPPVNGKLLNKFGRKRDNLYNT